MHHVTLKCKTYYTVCCMVVRKKIRIKVLKRFPPTVEAFPRQVKSPGVRQSKITKGAVLASLEGYSIV